MQQVRGDFWTVPGLAELLQSAYVQDTLRSIGAVLGSPQNIGVNVIPHNQAPKPGMAAFVMPTIPDTVNVLEFMEQPLRQTLSHELSHTQRGKLRRLGEKEATRLSAIVEALAESSAWSQASEDEVISRAQNIYKKRWNETYGPTHGEEKRAPDLIGMPKKLLRKIAKASIYVDHPLNKKERK